MNDSHDPAARDAGDEIGSSKLLKSIDRTWMNNLDTSKLLDSIDRTWMNNLNTSKLLDSIDRTWISNLNTSKLVDAVDRTWLNNLDTSKLLESIDRTWMNNLDTRKLLDSIDRTWISNLDTRKLLDSIDRTWISNLDTSKLLDSIDRTWISNLNTSKLLDSIDRTWISNLNTSKLLDAVDTSWLRDLAAARPRRFRHLPPNWWKVTIDVDLDGGGFLALLLDEGIPLAWVPRAALIDRLISATDGKRRRQLIRDGWRGIVRDCVESAGELPSRQARGHARFVHLAASAIRDGHYEAAQALAANLIDTLGQSFVRSQTVGHNWSIVTAKNQREKLSRVAVRTLLVLGPLSAGHGHYRPGDAVPRAFSRHATAHGVAPRQYTRVNSLIALMNATALLCWLERDSEAFRD